MTVGELKTVLVHLPDDMEIGIGINKWSPTRVGELPKEEKYDWTEDLDTILIKKDQLILECITMK